MVIQKTKNFFNHFYICMIIMFISIIKSCINKPVEHFIPVLSLNFEFLMSEDEEKENGSFPMRYIAYWGILAVANCNYISKGCPEGGI